MKSLPFFGRAKPKENETLVQEPPTLDTINRRIAALDFFKDGGAPRLRDFVLFNPGDAEQSAELLARYKLRANSYDGNLVLIHKAARAAREETPLNLHGHRNVVLIDRETGLHGRVDVTDNDNLAIFMGEQGFLAIDVRMYGGDTFVWGRHSVSWGVRVWIQGGRTCTIGEDCLFSENTTIRTTDHHTMFDLDTLEAINAPRDVNIGKHVWVGQDCAIGKGVHVGNGSILGARSFLNASIGSAELWGGSPARKLRDRVSWVVSHPEMDAIQRDKVMRLLKDR